MELIRDLNKSNSIHGESKGMSNSVDPEQTTSIAI